MLDKTYWIDKYKYSTKTIKVFFPEEYSVEFRQFDQINKTIIHLNLNKSMKIESTLNFDQTACV